MTKENYENKGRKWKDQIKVIFQLLPLFDDEVILEKEKGKHKLTRINKDNKSDIYKF